MTIDKAKLRALADAFPEGLDFDSNTEPFFNGPSGESLGGGSTGFYSVYGKPFEIDGEQYDGTEYVSICTREFAEFICSARDGVLALLDENERLSKSPAAQAVDAIATAAARHLASEAKGCLEKGLLETIEQLKAENLRLHRDLGRAGRNLHESVEPLRRDAERYRWLRDGASVILSESVGFTAESGARIYSTMPTQRELDSAIDAAMAKEAGHD